ncbi:hypothetical protein Q75_00230 [Bacillus coahuilensis p1.1.43]|uniref:Polymerase/histidinol phosphatase N-terminal domain-containing protein n=1 Tax=Bacillus coahuilensis p1.1.43 TaxID=1150625 RepID=A0A147KCM1_9BACI|nr:cell wall-binding repeat-containing protein [Bacillus coahuilensis]KUP09392.1 hypothetical protein Q75_00230 [Bacillus coahuilensis p1.1.43]
MTVQGIITFAQNSTAMYIQDATGGIKIDTYGKNVPLDSYAIGDKVKVMGVIDEYNSELEVSLEDAANITVVSKDNEIPAPKSISSQDLGNVQGEWVKISSAKVNTVGSTLKVEDANGAADVYTGNAKNYESSMVEQGKSYDFVGIASNFKGTNQLKLTDGKYITEPAPVDNGDATPIKEARAKAAGETVTVQGVVTHAETDKIMYIQDSTGGIKIDNFTKAADITTFVEGDLVKIEGKISGFKDELQVSLEKADAVTLISKNNPLPAPKTITLDQLEETQGELVKIEMAQIVDTSNNYNIVIKDTKGTQTNLYFAAADNFNKTSDVKEGQYFTIVGVAAKYTSVQMKLRNGADLELQDAPEDAKLPLIFNVVPKKMESTFDARPVISGQLEAAGSALDFSTFSLVVDGEDVTGSTTLDQTNLMFDYTPSSDFAVGEHSVVISISDVSGAKNEITTYFYVQDNLNDEDVNTYFGVPHAHTGYSDGKGTPTDAYQMAYEQGLDYLVVTDHSNSLEGDEYVSDRKEFIEKEGSEWAKTKEMAEEFNAAHEGEFLAVRGFEMTYSDVGHSNVINSTDYVERKTMTQLNDFYEWLTTEENVVAAFNHPNWPSDSFNDLAYDPKIDHIMAMIEVGNGAPPYSYARAEESFIKAMDNGWHVGAINGQDNHSTNWGVPDNLTAVVAEDLTNESFIEALKLRRVYSTEARDTELKVKANDFWMGSTLNVADGSELDFEITVKDQDDPISTVQILTNGGQIIDSVEAGEVTEFSWNPTIVDGQGANWYVVKVIHTNGLWTTASAIFTTGGEMDVKLTNLEVNPDPSLPGQESELAATITNMGVRGVEDLEVKFFSGSVSEENYISTGTVEYIGPGKSMKATAGWTPTAAGQNKIIAVLTDIPGVTTVTQMDKSVKVVESNNKKVMIDGSHGNADVPGSMNQFMELLRRNGYQAVINTQPITAESLVGFDVLVINAPSTGKAYTAAEEKVIGDWVKAGGSLMLSSKSNYGYDNSIVNPLLAELGSGIRINNDNVYEPNTSDKFSGGMKWSVYAYNVPETESGLNDNIEAIRYFSGASLVDENLGALTNDSESGLEILVGGNSSSYNFNVADGYHTYNEAIGAEGDENQTSGPNGEDIPIIAKEYVGEGRILVSGRHFYSDFEIVNDVSNTSFTLRTMDWLADYDRIKTIEDVRNNAEEGDIVTVQGTVTAPTNKFFDTVYIQDETGGISLFGTQNKDLPVGTVVIATGGVTTFEGELELEYENFDMEILYVGPGEEVDPVKISTKEVSDGTFNGMLVTTEGTIKDMNDEESYFIVNDGKADARVLVDGYLPLDVDRFKTGDKISVTGIASSGASGNRIRVRFAEDLVMLQDDGDDDGGEDDGNGDKEEPIEEISGKDRIATAVEISKELHPNGFGKDHPYKTVLISTGYNFPDGLSAGPLATALNGPILPVDSKGKLTSEVLNEVKRLGAENVYLVGGKAVVSDDVIKQLINIGVKKDKIERLVTKDKEDRYGTNLAIVKKLQKLGFDGNGVFIATGNNFADALSAAAVAGVEGMPIVLTNGKSLSKEALSVLKGEEVYILGGRAAISDQVVVDAISEAKFVTRISGCDRYGTLSTLLKRFDTGQELFIASGVNYPDALFSSPLVGDQDGTLLLVHPDYIPAHLSTQIESMIDENNLTSVRVLGGNQAVSDKVRDKLEGYLK